MNHPFRPSATVALSVLLAILVLGGQWVAYSVSSNVLEESVRSREIERINTVASVAKGLIAAQEADAQLVARLAVVDDSLGRNLQLSGALRKDRLSAQMDRVFAQGGSQTLEVIDRSEQVVYRAHAPARFGDQAKSWGVPEALSGLSMSASTRTPEGLLIQAIEPVRVAGDVVGAVAAGVLLNPKLVDELSRQVGAHLALLDREGLTLGTRSTAAGEYDLDGVKKAFQDKVPVYRFDARARQTSVYLPVTIVDEAYVVLARLDSADAYGLIESGNRRSALYAGLILAASLVFGFVALRWVMGPLRRLRLRAENTAVDLTGESIAATGRDEVTSVVKVLDTLTDRLLQRNAELSRAKLEADAASLAKSQFLSSMSHEIRTPLNGVLGMAELLRDSPLNPDQSRYVNAIESAGRVLHGLLSDVLDLAKIEEGQVKLERIDFNPVQAVLDLSGVYSEMASMRNLTLQTDVSKLACTWASGDPTRLRQVLSNLLSNAVKFTQQGEIRLGAQCIPSAHGDARQWFRFSVEDTGIGIAPDALQKLFQRFEQADLSTTRQFGGSGLGLTICKHLVELMGGKVHVQSVPGQGSRFWFDIPLEAALTPEASVATAFNDLAAAGLRILVAEDNAINQLVVKTLLIRLGAAVTIVENGQQAVQEFMQGGFDAVFMDCQMPVMDGFEATRQIRVLEQRRSGPRVPVPIVALTANVLAGDREACLDAGMNGYVPKPVTSLALAQALQTHCSGVTAGVAAPSPSPAVLPASQPHKGMVFDPQVLARLPMVADGSDPGFATEMLDLFTADAHKALENIGKALLMPDMPALKRLVHTLKSSAAQVGAMALSDEAMRQELLLRNGHMGEAGWHERLKLALAQFEKVRAASSGWGDPQSGTKV